MIPETEAPRAGAVPRAAGKRPAVVRGHAAAPWAAGAGRPRPADPSQGPLNTLLAGGAAVAARLYGQAEAVLAGETRPSREAVQPVAARRVPAAVPRPAARQAR